MITLDSSIAINLGRTRAQPRLVLTSGAEGDRGGAEAVTMSVIAGCGWAGATLISIVQGNFGKSKLLRVGEVPMVVWWGNRFPEDRC